MGNLSLALLFYGLAIVISMLVAVLIKGIVVSLSLSRPKAAPPVLRPPAPAEDTEADIAVIAAAVYAMLGAHRIVHIEAPDRGRVWTAAARASHHASHHIGRRARR